MVDKLSLQEIIYLVLFLPFTASLSVLAQLLAAVLLPSRHEDCINIPTSLLAC